MFCLQIHHLDFGEVAAAMRRGTKHNDSLLCCNPKRLGSKSAIKSKKAENYLVKQNKTKKKKKHTRARSASDWQPCPFWCIQLPRLPLLRCGGTVARPSGQEVEGLLVEAAAAAALSTSVVVGELSAQEMGCHGACLLAIILAS